jgi:putative restriction endonuclease
LRFRPQLSRRCASIRRLNSLSEPLLALCKIHHAAYDRDIVAVRPDLIVQVRHDVLAEIDGPMLRHGLQEMDGVPLLVPRRREARPDRAALEERYEAFWRSA